MLRARLFAFLRSLPKSFRTVEDEKQIVRAVLLYTIGRRKAADFRILGRRLGITEELYGFKSQFLDRNYYAISQFWRVVFEYFRRLPVQAGVHLKTTKIDAKILLAAIRSLPNIPKNQRRSCAADVRLMEKFLTLEDHQRLLRLARSTAYDTPSELDLLPILRKLQSFSLNLARYKARFISNNDDGLSTDDIAMEIFEAGLRTIREFDAEISCGEKLLNTGKKGARNHCNRLIDFHTTKKRNRIVRVDNGGDFEYQSTTISLNRDVSRDQDDSPCFLIDTIEDESTPHDEEFVEQQWLGDLLRAVPTDVSRVVRIALGDLDSEFEGWLENRSKRPLENMQDSTVARYACEFVGVPMSAVRKVLLNDQVIASRIRATA